MMIGQPESSPAVELLRSDRNGKLNLDGQRNVGKKPSGETSQEDGRISDVRSVLHERAAHLKHQRDERGDAGDQREVCQKLGHRADIPVSV